VYPQSALPGFAPPRSAGGLHAYPYLEAADIDEALRYAACLSEDETTELSR
jgi:hypothetical protein